MRYDHYESGVLYGVRYGFNQGERLWPHQHTGETADQAHNIVVLRGSVRFEGQPENRVLCAGDIHDFDGAQLHSIIALEPNTVTLHMMLHGKPAAFNSYTADMLHGDS